MDYYILSPLLFVLRIIEVIVQLSLTLTIAGTKVGVKRFCLGAILFATLFEIIKVVTPQYLSGVLSVFLAISIVILVYKINFKKAIISYLITGITIAILDCIVCTILVKIYNLQSFEELSQSTLLMAIAKILISISAFFITKIISKYQININKNKTDNIKNDIEIMNVIITFCLLIPNLIMIVYYHDNKTLPLYIILVNIIAVIAMFFISLYNTQRGIRLIQAEEELVSEKIYNNTLQHLVDSLRTFKHDYDNTLITIDGYIFVEDWGGLKAFIKDVLKETKTITALNKLNPDLFKNPSLYGLVTAKFEYARKSDVTMNLEIYADLDSMDIKTYDFTRTLGIFLDNAIEASAISEKKIVNFSVMEKNNKIIIDISNSFSDTGLKLDDINKKGVSSKGENRGLGLYKVNEILNKYPKIKHETKAANGIFLQRLIIDKVKLPVS